jgi:hypothetical protein
MAWGCLLRCASDESPRATPTRRWPLAIVLLLHVGCQEDCSGLPDFTFADCQYDGLAWTMGSPAFTKAEDLVDPAASPLVAKVRIGQVILLGPVMPVEICTQTRAPSVTWTSSAPQVAAVQATGSLSGSLTGLAEGEATVLATIEGSRTQMQFRCCAPSCVSPPPLPNCQDVPVATVRVVP